MERGDIEAMSSVELSMWFKENGVQDSYCELFEGKIARLMWNGSKSILICCVWKVVSYCILYE